MRPWLKQHFPRVDKLVDQYGYWLPFLTSVWGLVTWAASSVPSISQYGWGAVLFAGIGVFCVLVLVASVAMVAWRIFRPLPPSVPLVAASGAPNAIHPDSLWQKFSDLDATVASLFKHSDETLAKVGDDLRGQIKASNERIEATAKSHRYDLSLLADRLFALKTTHELRRLHRDIERLSALLEKPLKQPKEERDWSAWPVRFRNFLRATTKFSHLAGAYYPDEASILTRADPSIYRISDGDFALENFPDQQMAYDFKTFRQRRVSYEEIGKGMLERIESKTRP